MNLTPEHRQTIVAALKAGNKIEAIKLCRTATGMGLAEAKDFVERMEASPDAPPSPAPEAGALSPVAELLFKGEKIAAIKLYREQVKPGIGLKEAKEEVERLEAGLRAQHPEKFSAPAKSGCTAVLAVLAVFVVVVVVSIRR
jgi:ribosomal protein L7/L12